MKTHDVAIIGAGPYGLSVAAHLAPSGKDLRIFGRPMTMWREHMPKGMVLKSDGYASSLSAPTPGNELRDYCAKNNIPYHDTELPVPLQVFGDYALDFQRRLVPSLDQRSVTAVTQTAQGFELQLEDGEKVAARKVVFAVGVIHFPNTPRALSGFGSEHVSHSSDHHDMERFRDRDVTVIGAGSSAIDVAASLLDSGARVTIVSRAGKIKYAAGGGKPSLWRTLRHPPSGLGPSLRSRIYCDWPHLFRYLPAWIRLPLLAHHLGPFSHWYMEPRVAKAKVLCGAEVESAVIKGGRIVLNLRRDGEAGTQIEADHVITATGYKVDLTRLPFMDPKLRSRIRLAGTTPDLSAYCESSVKGLYFAGLAAAGSFGPMMRFVFGVEFAARRISKHIAG